ncbi:MAG TPA: DUF3179 domain-containing (seleno)protein [Candidatus Sumerlaeota bacterium]|nr:DUF3179 domain-containing (seleno)protein [Candidatus Sumerlaeota bacterium]HOR26995.1 DUF3179 domain-containing (seleno)protein [Candidatus Sumerlaeota bacterium]
MALHPDPPQALAPGGSRRERPHAPPPGFWNRLNARLTPRLRRLLVVLLIFLTALAAYLVGYEWTAGYHPVRRAAMLRASGEAWLYDLNPLRIDADQLFHSPLRADTIPALVDPELLSAADAAFLDDDDLVLGVALDGAARAYPLLIIEWHELVNDTLAGHPLLVVHQPFSGATAVYTRRIGPTVPEFGIGSLIFNSRILLYERRAEGRGQSLWDGMTGQAVSGARAAEGAQLARLPFERCSWRAWRARHPDTTVVGGNQGLERPYRAPFFRIYEFNDQVYWPMPEPSPARPDLGPKELMFLLWVGGRATPAAFALSDLAQTLEHRVDVAIAGRRVRLEYDPAGQLVRVHPLGGDAEDLRWAYAYRFTLDAAWPAAPIWRPRFTYSQ